LSSAFKFLSNIKVFVGVVKEKMGSIVRREKGDVRRKGRREQKSKNCITL
jgi:hypothetical protein